MNTLELARSPQLIAAEIRSIDTQTREIVLRSAIEIGKRLNEAKSLVPHGEWGSWLETNVHYSQSTANNFMRIAEEYGSNFQAIENLSYTKALALLGIPEDERQQFAQDHDVENMSARELQQAIKEKKQLEKQLKKTQEDVEKERKEREALQTRFSELEKQASDHQSRISQLQAELADAKIADNNDEITRLQELLDQSKNDLTEAQSEVKRLETELKAKPIEVSAVTEKIPEEVERELAELRKLVAQSGNATIVKFKAQFDLLVSSFRDLLATLDEIKTSDTETFEKYKVAVSGLISKMSERL